eukprot:766550-Hanusia_phi.AAC.7
MRCRKSPCNGSGGYAWLGCERRRRAGESVVERSAVWFDKAAIKKLKESRARQRSCMRRQ